MVRKLLMTASVYAHIRNFHLPYLREFQDRGWITHVACMGIPTDTPFIDKSFDLPFHKSMTAPTNFQIAWKLRKLIREEQYDLVITHTSLASFFTCLAVKGMRVRPKIINVMHGYLFDDATPFYKREILINAEYLIAPETDLLLVMNQWDYLAAKQHKFSRHIELIPGMGVDFDRLDEAAEADGLELRKNLGIPEPATVLIYAAEFSLRKSQHTLIEAMKYLPDNCCLVLPGDGEYWSKCKQLAEHLGFADRVIFPGQITEIGPWLLMADIAVTASRSEGLPFNVMEAMYIGLPVVASAVKGHMDLIRDGETGLLYQYGNTKTCAECILQLMDDAALRDKLRNNARKMIQPYGLKNTFPAVMNCYLSVLDQEEL